MRLALALLVSVSCACTGASSPVDLTVVGRFGAPLAAAAAYPTRLAVAADGTVFASDPKAGRVVGTRAGEPTVALEGFDRPLGVAVAGDLLYVGSEGRGSVEVFDLARRAPVGVLGAGRGEFRLPNAIAVGPDGVVYVADSRANVVRAYGPDRALRQTLGAGELRFPAAVAVDATRVVVADQGHHRVVVFDHAGAQVRAIGGEIPLSATSTKEYRGRFTRAQGVALAGDDIVVLDSYHGHLQTLAADGSWKSFRSLLGTCAACVRLGLDVTVGPDGALLVADPENGRVIAAREVTR